MYCLPYEVGISPTLHIRGMIANCDIKKGEVIERCPVIEIPKKEWPLLYQTKLQNYYFDWTNNAHVIALGYGSLVNHSFTPNAAYRWDYKNKYMVYFAVSNIVSGDEVTINYNGDLSDKSPLPDGWVNLKSY